MITAPSRLASRRLLDSLAAPLRRIAPALLLLILGSTNARAEELPAAAIPAPRFDAGRGSMDHPIRRPGQAGDGGTASASGPGGWISAAGFLMLIVGGGAGFILMRNRASTALPAGSTLQVIGRTALGPRHAAYLVRAGDRVLVVGIGTGGGPPALLAELEPEAVGSPTEPPPLRLARRPEGQGEASR